MGTLERLQAAPRVAVVVLAVGLVVAVAGGLRTRQPAPVPYPAVEGRTLARATGAGPRSAASTVGFERGAVGVALRCDGHGSIRIDLQPFGSVESPCRAPDAGEGGYVLSDLSSVTTRWRVRTAAGNRWSLVLTQPLLEGGSWSP